MLLPFYFRTAARRLFRRGRNCRQENSLSKQTGGSCRHYDFRHDGRQFNRYSHGLVYYAYYVVAHAFCSCCPMGTFYNLVYYQMGSGNTSLRKQQHKIAIRLFGRSLSPGFFWRQLCWQTAACSAGTAILTLLWSTSPALSFIPCRH